MTFYPVILFSTLFCISIFIVIAATFGDPTIPVNQWVNRHANVVLLVETVLLMFAAIGAMTVDRIRTLRRLAAEKELAARSESEVSNDVD